LRRIQNVSVLETYLLMASILTSLPAFARVTMLYIDVLVNNVPIKAFVDSGAQTTIMSPDAAARCNIERLIDSRYGGIARGVGTAKILGRVHSADIQIGQYNLASSFTVMEGKEVDLLLGLDMLKRHQMCIDLRQNCLIVQDDRIPFLGEAELPKMMDEILEEEPKVDGPAGTTVGARTGTVEKAEGSSSVSAGKAPANKPKINIHPAGSAGNIASRPSGSASQPKLEDSPFGKPQPITEASIKQITDMGFPRQAAEEALRQTNGNVELALGLLF
jgi:DNA damage-inducible protein 1